MTSKVFEHAFCFSPSLDGISKTNEINRLGKHSMMKFEENLKIARKKKTSNLKEIRLIMIQLISRVRC